MRNLIFIITALLFMQLASAQKQCTVSKASAFFRTVPPGNIPVDENGNPRVMPENKERYIYLFSSCKSKPDIEELRYGNDRLNAGIAEGPQKSFFVGISSAGKKTILRAAPGYFIWKINVDGATAKRYPQKIFIKGKVGLRPFALRLYGETELQIKEMY